MATIQTENYFNSIFKSNNALKNWLILLFFSLGLIGILHHEMWRDELQSWLIAKDSSSIIDLFNNLRYEAHPALWHSCLYLITRFTHNPLAMQIFHLLLATSVIYVFIEFSPFTRFQKILFTFGYFPFYEYSIISRSYSLGILLIFIFCALYPTRNRNYFPLSVILALLANTHAYGLIFALFLAMTLVLDGFLAQDIRTLFKTKKWQTLVSLAIVCLGILMGIFQIIPLDDADFKSDVIRLEDWAAFPLLNNRLFATILTIWRSYIPIPNFFQYQFWNTNILINGDSIARICAISITIIILLYSAALFIRKPIVLFLYLCGTCGFLVFSYTKFIGSLRHHGNLFFLFLACVWISSFYIKSDLLIEKLKSSQKILTRLNLVDRYKNVYLSGILFAHVIAGLLAVYLDFNYTFSGSKEVANYIDQQGLKDYVLVGSRDYAAAPVAGFLNRQIYYLESDKLGSFIVWRNRKLPKQREVLDRVERLIKQNNKALLILNYKLKVKRNELNISFLFKSSQSIVPDETYYLYLIQKKPVNN
ncbi:hypothetical protein [Microseira sp. BLCC-F43]|jgi:hypothetical protein|uniref:hypothetical protein n=1 Tax=Microseira sp. BLCC-F43 TaxID=3153602 RepID=UPI0035BAD434